MSIAHLILIELVGAPPTTLSLPPLTTIASSVRVVRAALTPFLADDATVDHVSDLKALAAVPPREGLTALYLVGHAWLTAEGSYTVAALDESSDKSATRLLDGSALVDLLVRLVPPGSRAACLVDTCVAAALAGALPGALGNRCTFVFASGAEESALEYPLDDATRFALAFRDALAAAPAEMDVVKLAFDIERRIRSAILMPPQEVTYWSVGSPLVLRRVGVPDASRGWRTHRILRTLLLSGGAAFAIFLIAAAAYYRAHERLHLMLGDVASIADDVRVQVSRLDPAANVETLHAVYTPGTARQYRVIVPADDYLVAISARYRDGKPRIIHFHLNHRPSWDWATKTTELRLPSAREIAEHPAMAYVPAGPWLEGATKTRTMNPRPFWVDIAPVTVKDYLPFAFAAVAAGSMEPYRSVLLHDIEDAAGVEATGMRQLPKLLGDLGAVFGVIDAAERPIARQTPYEEAAAALPRVQMACANCPAPMSLDEARAYCQSRGMRLPTRPQWELAARGTDGRRFPWGDAWGEALGEPRHEIYGNAGFPPDVGKPMRIRPSTDFPRGVSPFGVLDLVGNAGDWIEPEGSYGHLFMGGLYRYNQDDCTTFSVSPDTGELLPRYEVTCRCVTP